MRIAIVTVGSRGDIQPYVALGVGLQSAGHEVWLATYPHFEPFVARYGVGFRPVANAFEELSDTDAWAAWQKSGNRPARFVFHLGRLLQSGRSCFIRIFEDAWRASQDADAIIYPTAGLGGPDIAEKLGIPGYWAHLYPAGRTAQFPCFAGPTWLRLGPAYNRLTYRIAARVYRRLFGSALDEWRAQSLGLAPRRSGALNPFEPCDDPVLYGFSPILVPKPRDWVDTQHITGYWFLRGAVDCRPPEALSAFLDAGPPPIYVSASSLHGDRALLQALVTNGTRRADCRLIVQGRNRHELGSLPDEVFVTGDEPSYDWLFPRVRGVVHHGGPGTVATALSAGVPSLAVPAFFDQPFWSRRLFELGVSPPPIPVRQLTLDRLVEGLSNLATDTRLQSRASSLAAAVRDEDGVSAAVEVLCRDLTGRRHGLRRHAGARH
jgi:UDP:flavonoid glycosyltransferase YjiC (YdhE family)